MPGGESQRRKRSADRKFSNIQTVALGPANPTTVPTDIRPTSEVVPKDGLDQLPVLLEFVQHTDVLNQCGIDSQPRRQRVHTYSKADEKVPTLEYTPIKRCAPSTVAESMSSMCTGMRCTKDSTSCPILNQKIRPHTSCPPNIVISASACPIPSHCSPTTR